MSNAAQNDPLYRLSTLIETETWQDPHSVMREIVQAGMQEIARLRAIERAAMDATEGMTLSTMFEWGDKIPGNTGIFAKSIALNREWDMAFNYDCIRRIASLRNLIANGSKQAGE